MLLTKFDDDDDYDDDGDDSLLLLHTFLFRFSCLLSVSNLEIAAVATAATTPATATLFVSHVVWA